MEKEVASYQEKAVSGNGDSKLYEGMLLTLKVFTESCHFYEKQALDQAESAFNSQRKQELLKMADALGRIAYEPPSTFREAIQMAWLYTLMCGTLELGRMDIYLGDFYAHDIDQGILSEEEALGLMKSLWRLINDLFREVDGRVIVGGKGRPNENNADRFALLALETTRAYGRAKLPQLTVRFYKGMNPEIMEKSIELIGAGHTFPLLYNDDVLIPAVQNAHNVPLADAEQYVPLGCGEIVLDHMGFGTPSGALNMLKALEITLHNGVDPITNKQLGLKTGEFKDFRSFDELWEAYKKAIDAVHRSTGRS